MGILGKVKCPVCQEVFELESDLEIGDFTDCPSCASELQIMSLDPLRVEEAAESGEDYFDEEDEENN